MKALQNQTMQNLEAGGLGCLIGGIALGFFFTPAVGIGFDIACQLLTPTKAY